jgi:hypothetical protein
LPSTTPAAIRASAAVVNDAHDPADAEREEFEDLAAKATSSSHPRARVYKRDTEGVALHPLLAAGMPTGTTGGRAPSWQADPHPDNGPEMRKDVREFIRRLEAVGLTVESTPGHYRVLRDGKPLRKANGMPFTLPFSPDTIRWRRAAIVELRKLGINL